MFAKEGDAWSVVSYYRKFARLRSKIAARRSFDSCAFRHTFAYHFRRKEGTLSQLQALLGHRSIDMTVFMYGGIADKKTEKTTPYDF
ncbi:tyrosine-type recombinase/integrase [Bdellovibrio sp. ArHS]|uniref:tyrosine-type recombinase/integrase n=1 Tax=Bdellovibrio sp. ArHS TaxID=1569284 RepID=UPI00342513CD